MLLQELSINKSQKSQKYWKQAREWQKSLQQHSVQGEVSGLIPVRAFPHICEERDTSACPQQHFWNILDPVFPVNSIYSIVEAMAVSSELDTGG